LGDDWQHILTGGGAAGNGLEWIVYGMWNLRDQGRRDFVNQLSGDGFGRAGEDRQRQKQKQMRGFFAALRMTSKSKSKGKSKSKSKARARARARARERARGGDSCLTQ